MLNGAPISSGTTIALGNVASITFVVTRQAVGPATSQATMVSFTVRDRCGDWHSFVGGGPGAF